MKVLQNLTVDATGSIAGLTPGASVVVVEQSEGATVRVALQEPAKVGASTRQNLSVIEVVALPVLAASAPATGTASATIKVGAKPVLEPAPLPEARPEPAPAPADKKKPVLKGESPA